MEIYPGFTVGYSLQGFCRVLSWPRGYKIFFSLLINRKMPILNSWHFLYCLAEKKSCPTMFSKNEFATVSNLKFISKTNFMLRAWSLPYCCIYLILSSIVSTLFGKWELVALFFFGVWLMYCPSRKHAYIILTPLNPTFIKYTGVYRGVLYFSYFCSKQIVGTH